MLRLVVFSLILLLLCPVSMQAQGLLATLFPEVVDYPPPPWLREGVRFVQYLISGSVPQDKYRYFSDEHGGWVDQHGNRYSFEAAQGTGGQGITVVDVVAIAGHEVAVVRESFSMIGDSILPMTKQGVTGGLAYWDELFVNPAFLATVQETNLPGLMIIRGPFTLGETTYSAIRFQTETAASRYAQVYDLNTGICLFAGLSGLGTSGDSLSQMGTPTGTVSVIQASLLHVRELNIPWLQGELSQVSQSIRRMHYDGYTMFTTTSFPLQTKLWQSYQTKESSPRWIAQKVTSTTEGYEVFATEKAIISGIAQFGGVFIPPLALSILAEGQIIDTDPVTGFQVRVIFNGTTPEGYRRLGIRVAGRDFFCDYYYDQDGVLVGTQLSLWEFRWAQSDSQRYTEYWLTYLE